MVKGNPKKTRFSKETEDFINQRNIENWLDMNRELALFIHQGEERSRQPCEIHGTKFGEGTNLTKTLGRGVAFGALRQFTRFGRYYLTAKAEEYLGLER